MFSERPEITIILLTHDRPTSFQRAVESIYAQTFQKFELIILDNGSVFDYPENIKDYINSKNNLRYIQLKENNEYLGQVLNQGLSLAQGKYISFLMDDDLYEKDALNILYTAINKGLDLVYGKVISVDANTNRIVPNSYANTDWKKGTSKSRNPIHLTSALINRDVFDRLGGFHETMLRSFDLDLWNRIFKDSKCLRLDKVISRISVNNLNSVSGKRKPDSLEAMSTYPLTNYWFNRKSISFLGDEKDFIKSFNKRNSPWIATSESLETDATMSWAYTDGLDDFPGERYYYVDHPALFIPSMENRCDGVISQFPLESEKPSHLLRPFISRLELKEVDKTVYYLNQKYLRLLCPKLTEDNLDFILVLLGYLSDRFDGIDFYLFENSEAVYEIKQINKVTPRILEEDNYFYFKKLSIDAVLHIEGDTNSYIEAYNSLLTSTAIKAPLVSSPNIAFLDVLEKGVDYYEADTIQKYVQAIMKTKDIEIRETLVKNLRKKTNLYFLEQTVLDKFTLFLNSLHTDKIMEIKGITSVEQLLSDGSKTLQASEILEQEFFPTTSSFNAVQFFGKSLNNNSGFIFFSIKADGVSLESRIIPNYKIKNGINTVLFDSIEYDASKQYTFTVTSDSQIFDIEYLQSILNVGTFFINRVPKKSCLKFKILNDAVLQK